MAKLCLEALSVVDRNILIGSHRAHLWPEGFTGAISHTSDRVLALVAETMSHRFVGLDVENWLDAETVELISSDSNREQEVNSMMATSSFFRLKKACSKQPVLILVTISGLKAHV